MVDATVGPHYRVECEPCGVSKTVPSQAVAEDIDSAGHSCSYCRELKHDCRPVAVVNREFIPALCDGCYRALDDAGRLDHARDREVFFP